MLVHGAGGGAWEWNIWMRVFAASGWCCEALDLQPADAGLAVTSLADYTAQVEQVLARQAQPAVLIGASLGALLALRCAHAAAALVLVNPLPPKPWQLGSDKVWPEIVPWRRARSLEGTRRAMTEADDAACLYAFRRWRDESGRVLNEAHAGVEVVAPAVACLVMASIDDTDVPHDRSVALAQGLGASLLNLPGGHLAPLLGRGAATAATQAVAWLNTIRGFTTD